MLNNNNHNSSCNFADQVVSFIYGEISEAEKSNFKAHLLNCSACSDEVSDFGFVRSSIQEWRGEDFQNLRTPVFEIPFPKKPEAPVNSWVELIRDYFSPSLIRLTVGFAALLIFAGFIWFLNISSYGNQEIASNSLETTGEISPKPLANAKPAESFADADLNSQKDHAIFPKPVNQVQNIQASETNDSIKVAKQNTKNLSTVKPRNSATVKSDKINNKTASKTPKKNNIPSLSEEEYQDRSLRLSDILEEVSMR